MDSEPSKLPRDGDSGGTSWGMGGLQKNRRTQTKTNVDTEQTSSQPAASYRSKNDLRSP